MAEEKIDNTLGEVKNIMENKREDWVCHSQAIAAAMSNRMELLGMTQKALAMNMSLETLCKIEKALDVKILNSNIKVK